MERREILIADKDNRSRRIMANMLMEAGYDVTVSSSAVNLLYGVLKKDVQVVLLGDNFDEMEIAELVRLLKACDRRVPIILVSGEASLPVVRRVRQEGIFYHALKPASEEDGDEIRLAVECAFNRSRSIH